MFHDWKVLLIAEPRKRHGFLRVLEAGHAKVVVAKDLSDIRIPKVNICLSYSVWVAYRIFLFRHASSSSYTPPLEFNRLKCKKDTTHIFIEGEKEKRIVLPHHRAPKLETSYISDYLYLRITPPLDKYTIQ